MDAALRYPGAHVVRLGDKPAVVMAPSGESMTYRELDEQAWRYARAFRSLGLTSRDAIAICIENRIEYPALQWGAHYAGLYYPLLSTHLKVDEVAHILRDSGAGVVILSSRTATDLLVELRDAAPEARFLTIDESDEGLDSLTELARNQTSEPLPDATEGGDLLYSSGTTGVPKGIEPATIGDPLGTNSLVADLANALFGFGEDVVYLSPAPYYHAAPSRWVRATTSVGGTAVLLERFDPEQALAAVQTYRVTHSQWVPTMFTRMLRLPEAVRDSYDLSSHRVAIHAAAPCPPDVKRAMLDWWGPILHEYYAGTEGNGMTHCGPHDWLTHPGSVGRSVFGTVHILNDEGQELPVGQVGGVYFEGGQNIVYRNDPAKTSEAHSPQGYTTMGDIGRLDEDGFLYLLDRRSNVIISGGVNIYPQEAENVLATHPTVADVAVIGVPDAEFGESVKAVVQPVGGTVVSDALAQELIEFCRARLSTVKCPRSIDFRNELPRHPTGKLFKRLLRDEYRNSAAV